MDLSFSQAFQGFILVEVGGCGVVWFFVWVQCLHNGSHEKLKYTVF